MHIFNVSIPDRPLTTIELSTYAQELEIPHFRCFYERYITTVFVHLTNVAITEYVIIETEHRFYFDSY